MMERGYVTDREACAVLYKKKELKRQSKRGLYYSIYKRKKKGYI